MPEYFVRAEIARRHERAPVTRWRNPIRRRIAVRRPATSATLHGTAV